MMIIGDDWRLEIGAIFDDDNWRLEIGLGSEALIQQQA